MKSAIFLSSFLFAILIANAQEYTSKVVGSGDNRKEIGIHTEKDGTKVTQIDNANKSRRIIWKKTPDGKYTCERQCIGDGWQYNTIIKLDENKKILGIKVTHSTSSHNEPYPKVDMEYESKRQPDGSLKGGAPYGTPYSADELKKLEAEYQKEIEEIEKDDPDPVSFNLVPCNPANGESCQSNVSFLAGPSVLVADFGSERKALFGGQLVVNLNVTRKISIGVSAGIYSKKFGMENLNRSLIMIDGQYAFGRPDDCDRKWNEEVHVLIGWAHESYGTSKGNGAIYGTGSGAVCRITKILGVKAQADLLALKWKDSDEWNIDYRISAGVELQLGHKRSGLTKDPNLHYKPTRND